MIDECGDIQIVSQKLENFIFYSQVHNSKIDRRYELTTYGVYALIMKQALAGTRW